MILKVPVAKAPRKQIENSSSLDHHVKLSMVLTQRNSESHKGAERYISASRHSHFGAAFHA